MAKPLSSDEIARGLERLRATRGRLVRRVFLNVEPELLYRAVVEGDQPARAQLAYQLTKAQLRDDRELAAAPNMKAG